MDDPYRNIFFEKKTYFSFALNNKHWEHDASLLQGPVSIKKNTRRTQNGRKEEGRFFAKYSLLLDFSEKTSILLGRIVCIPTAWEIFTLNKSLRTSMDPNKAEMMEKKWFWTFPSFLFSGLKLSFKQNFRYD